MQKLKQSWLVQTTWRKVILRRSRFQRVPVLERHLRSSGKPNKRSKKRRKRRGKGKKRVKRLKSRFQKALVSERHSDYLSSPK
jgi:hypothetical protein